MKALLLVCLCPWLAHAQGQFIFNNHVPPNIDARFDWAGGFGVPRGPLGPDWSVALIGAPSGASIVSARSLQPRNVEILAQEPSTFGYVASATLTVPNVPAGAAADIWIAFEKRGSATSDGIGGNFSQLGPWTVQLGGSDLPLAYLPLGTSPLVASIIPEPSTLALLLGATILTLFHTAKLRTLTSRCSGRRDCASV